MRNLKITLAYDGTNFRGWQVQPGEQTIQGALKAAIFGIIGEDVLPQGSGRTDAGVHALAQVASFSTSSTIPEPNLMVALNDILPPDIRVLGVEQAPQEFHARKSAQAKTYRYRIYRGAVCPPFLVRYVFHHPYPLNEDAMIEATCEVEGTHDFTSFAAVDPERNSDGEGSNLRTIFSSGWQRCPALGWMHLGDQASPHGEHELVYTVRGSGFLHHMVRNLIGCFLLVGKKTVTRSDLRRIIEARSRSANPGATAPASGLYLVGVEY